jgi:hypothetical protein
MQPTVPGLLNQFQRIVDSNSKWSIRILPTKGK